LKKVLLYQLLVDNPTCCGGKTTEMFCGSGNMKELLFEDEEYKGPIFGNYSIGKKLRVFR
jgi:hypothetical protein